ncbi:putative peptidoglycan binding protein [Hoeflea marina]|uniref:Putative peptidoglycan binding protein n=1 Tax=Hoeflea marina TaxID=274592 RepID=A0A317PLZ6_9HYPH|nr:peptidoglycan-binding protein [Hoeflea marina]PWV99083.1 putative peptidoglycan binding protein [Hoeflea marina]
MPTLLPVQRRGRRGRATRPASFAALLLAGSALAGAALAEEPIRPGEAFATRFSGSIDITLGDGTRLPLIDQDGVVGSLVDLRSPGFAADGRHWADEPQRMRVTAAEVGQVFGVAFDTGSPVNVLMAATSAFGLHRFDDGSDWLPGQWGEGGPGGLYRLNGGNGYAPELLATITLDGRQNTGAGLGDVAFDPGHRQIFVSDLETGMIHRLSAEGEDLGHFDHGAEGRPSFLDADSGNRQSLAAVAFDPGTEARLSDCTDEAGAPARFDATPSCWNYADFRRRVWGLAAFSDPVSGKTRLYYAVSAANGLGNPEWTGDSEEASNSIWSVALSDGGDFDRTDIRRELVLPGPVDASAPASVPDLAISDEGVMLVGERGAVRNLGLDAPQPFAVPHGARVLRYSLADTGLWMPQGRHDVGFYDRKADGQPFLRANASGGVDFGYGYDATGAADFARPAGSVWMTGDALCSPDGPCADPAGGRSDDSQVHGLQGTPAAATVDVDPPGARQPYPEGGDPYPADAMLASYLIDLDDNLGASGSPDRIQALKDDATRIGDVEVLRGAPAAAPASLEGYDLEIDKSGPVTCLAGTGCSFTLTITNNGPAEFSGPVNLWDDVEPFDAPLSGFSGDGWQCFEFAGGIHCGISELKLGVGEATDLVVTVTVPGNYRSDILTNCASVTWLYTAEGGYDVRSVQVALSLLGYDPGPIDGVIGSRTLSALAEFQSDNGLEPTGEMDEETAALLSPGYAGVPGDLDGSNDSDCHDVVTGDPLPVHTKWRSHLKTGSPHNKVQSHLKTGSPHNKLQSHLKTGSPHNKLQSHLKTGSPHNKLQSHLKTGSPHNKLQSHLKTGSPHNKVQSHLKTGSPHNKLQSHLKTGSPHNKLQSHLKTDSPHNKVQSHLKTGSPHNKVQSHLKTGSPHNKVQSHLKTGSPHNKLQSHLKTGSPHNKLQSHLKTGSPHNKLQSHLKAGSPHNKQQSHLKAGSPHNKILSNQKLQPVHTKAQSHLKTGSPHNKVQSIQKLAPRHTKAQSHLKTGSPHDKIISAQKVQVPVVPPPDGNGAVIRINPLLLAPKQ